MTQGTVRPRIHWLALHGFVRGISKLFARRGDPQGRLITDLAIRADPVPFTEELRAQGPLIKGRVVYLSVDHKVCSEVLRSEDFRVLSLGSNLPRPLQWVIDRTEPDLVHPIQEPSMLSVEGAQHTRYRKLVSSVFTTRAVATLRERVQDTANTLLDELGDQPGTVDIVERYCGRLPVTVIGDILGVPEADRPRVLEFGERGAASLDIGLTWPQYRETTTAVQAFNVWLLTHLRGLSANPGDDLMSQIIKASQASEDPLTEQELVATAGLVLAAGFETTVNLLGSGIRLLLQHPEHLETLAQRPELWPTAVEEILRLESPVQLTARTAARDTDLAGRRILAGQGVLVYIAGANRDPNVFTDPHRFDIERANAGRHLSFSGGRHFCVGAALARAEGEVGLRTFFERYPDARLAGPGVRRDTRVLRGWSSLPIALGDTQTALRS